MLYHKSGAWDKALREFELEQLAHPEDEQAVAGISECLLRLERYEALNRHLKAITAAKEPPEWALLDAASAAQALGRLDDAIRYLRQATLHYPDSPTVHRSEERRVGKSVGLGGRGIDQESKMCMVRLRDRRHTQGW